jgi:CTP synthase (UTP-ammonia lyase)
MARYIFVTGGVVSSIIRGETERLEGELKLLKELYWEMMDK